MSEGMELVFDEVTNTWKKKEEPYMTFEVMTEEDYNALRAKLDSMSCNQYQKLAARTINNDLDVKHQGRHALHGMVGEIGELHSIYQKKYQGHAFDEEHAKKELGDLLWFIAEYCTAHGWKLEDIARMNIDKLKARYPEGFEEDKSLNRAEGDI